MPASALNENDKTQQPPIQNGLKNGLANPITNGHAHESSLANKQNSKNNCKVMQTSSVSGKKLGLVKESSAVNRNDDLRLVLRSDSKQEVTIIHVENDPATKKNNVGILKHGSKDKPPSQDGGATSVEVEEAMDLDTADSVVPSKQSSSLSLTSKPHSLKVSANCVDNKMNSLVDEKGTKDDLSVTNSVDSFSVKRSVECQIMHGNGNKSVLNVCESASEKSLGLATSFSEIVEPITNSKLCNGQGQTEEHISNDTKTIFVHSKHVSVLLEPNKNNTANSYVPVPCEDVKENSIPIATLPNSCESKTHNEAQVAAPDSDPEITMIKTKTSHVSLESTQDIEVIEDLTTQESIHSSNNSDCETSHSKESVETTNTSEPIGLSANKHDYIATMSDAKFEKCNASEDSNDTFVSLDSSSNILPPNNNSKQVENITESLCDEFGSLHSPLEIVRTADNVESEEGIQSLGNNPGGSTSDDSLEVLENKPKKMSETTSSMHEDKTLAPLDNGPENTLVSKEPNLKTEGKFPPKSNELKPFSEEQPIETNELENKPMKISITTPSTHEDETCALLDNTLVSKEPNLKTQGKFLLKSNELKLCSEEQSTETNESSCESLDGEINKSDEQKLFKSDVNKGCVDSLNSTETCETSSPSAIEEEIETECVPLNEPSEPENTNNSKSEKSNFCSKIAETSITNADIKNIKTKVRLQSTKDGNEEYTKQERDTGKRPLENEENYSVKKLKLSAKDDEEAPLNTETIEPMDVECEKTDDGCKSSQKNTEKNGDDSDRTLSSLTEKEESKLNLQNSTQLEVVGRNSPTARAISKTMLYLSRKELEEIALAKTLEAISMRSKLTITQQELLALKEKLHEYKSKFLPLVKQVGDLKDVVSRIDEATKKPFSSSNTNKMIRPLKVTRSVGLQVCLNSPSNIKTNSSAAQAPGSGLSRTIRPVCGGNSSSSQETPRVNKVVVPGPVSAPRTLTTATSSPLPGRAGTGIRTLTPKSVATSSKTCIDLTVNEERNAGNSTAQSHSPAVISPSNNLLAGGSIRIMPQQSPNKPGGAPVAYLLQTPNQARHMLVPTSHMRANGLSIAGQMALNTLNSVQWVKNNGNIVLPHTAHVQNGVNTTRQIQMGNKSGHVIVRSPQVGSRGNIYPPQHPAPLPPLPSQQPIRPGWKLAPPKPSLKISKVSNSATSDGIVLSWSMNITCDHEDMKSYQIFAYQEGPEIPSTALWKKVGDVKALALPMACTLTQFTEGHKYHFAVCAVDIHSRLGPFSDPTSIILVNANNSSKSHT